MTTKLKAISKQTVIFLIISGFLAVTFILQLVPNNPNPFIPDWPYDTLFDGGIGGLGIATLYHVIFGIPGKIRDLGEKMEKNLLGSLKDSYPAFKEELTKRLTKTE